MREPSPGSYELSCFRSLRKYFPFWSRTPDDENVCWLKYIRIQLLPHFRSIADSWDGLLSSRSLGYKHSYFDLPMARPLAPWPIPHKPLPQLPTSSIPTQKITTACDSCRQRKWRVSRFSSSWLQNMTDTISALATFLVRHVQKEELPASIPWDVGWSPLGLGITTQNAFYASR
jgi:hypothetical protein